MKRVLLIIVLCSVVPSADAQTARQATRWAELLAEVPAALMMQVQEQAPPIAEVHRAVLRQADLLLDAPQEWARRARWAAALPRLQLGFRQSLKDNFDLRLEDQVSVTGAGVVIGPRSSDFAEQSDRNLQLDVRALWNLNELAFTPDAIFVSREARERREEIRHVLSEANRLLFEWQRWQVLALWATTHRPPRVPVATVQLQLAAVAAELDGLTGGWFSQALQAGGRS